MDANPKPLQTFWLLTIMNGASTIGRLTMAGFSDKTGQLNMHIVAQILSSLLCLVLWSLAGSTASAISFCVLFGMTSGTVIGLPPASIANILAGTYRKPEEHHQRHSKLGQWTGMMYTCAAVPALAGPVIAGHLVTKYQNYLTVQMWAGANLAISAACMLAARWYLPCMDGERVSEKLFRKRCRTVLEGKGVESGGEETDGEFGILTTKAILQAPTAVNTRQVSEQTVETMNGLSKVESEKMV